jgi:hypothetical protein
VAELRAVIDAMLDPAVEKVLKIEAQIPGVRWTFGERLSLTHDVVRSKDGKVAVAVGPGLPIPISGSFETGFSRQVHSSSSLQAWFAFASADAPTLDTPLDAGGTPLQPTLPGTTDGTPPQPLNQGGVENG